MTLIQTYLRATEVLHIPAHLQSFTDTSIEILEAAHGGSLDTREASLKTAFNDNTYRAYVEQQNLEHPLDYELLAIHLGTTTLSVCMQHRHVSDEHREQSSEGDFARSTVVFQNGGAKIFHSRVSGFGKELDITENKEAGHQMTSRLRHVLAVLGIQEAFAPELTLRAS